MAKKNGLSFNPGLGYNIPSSLQDISWEEQLQQTLQPNSKKEKKPSVPTVVDDYHVTFKNAPKLTEQLEVLKNRVNLAKWDAGVDNLPEDELNSWRTENAAKLKGKSDVYANRLWRNQQFAKTFGIDALYQYDVDDRDEMMRNKIIDDDVIEKYGNNRNFNTIDGLTPEGKVELLNSGYKSDWELRQDADKRTKWSALNLGNRWTAVKESASEYTSEGIQTGAFVGGAIGTPVGGPLGAGGGILAGAFFGGLTGTIYGTLKGIVDPLSQGEAIDYEERTNNEEILNKIINKDDERKDENTKDLQHEIFMDLLNKSRNGEFNINDEFDKIALNGEREVDEDSFGSSYKHTGSNYYSAFRHRDEFKNFTELDKLREIAKYRAIEGFYGEDASGRVLDKNMQNIVSDNQSKLHVVGKTLQNIGVGGVANLMNSAIALEELITYVNYGDKGLSEFLEGRDASGNGEENPWYKDPKFWDKVDRYNSLVPEVLERAEANGGVSTQNAIPRFRTEDKFGWYTATEALKMSKFAWSDALKLALLGRMHQGMVRAAGGVYTQPGVLAAESSKASQFINDWGARALVQASSLGIDAAYGYQTYEEVKDENNRKIDEIIRKNVDDRIKKERASGQLEGEFRAALEEEKKRREEAAKDGAKFLPIHEGKAFEDFLRQKREQYTAEEEPLHAEARQQAFNDAADAFAIDATIEQLRMGTTGAAFRRYLFDKGTLRTIDANTAYANVTYKNGKYALGKNPRAKLIAANVAAQIFGGFQSNYFDDVTVAYARGFQIQDYNNYLLQKYSPSAYGDVLDNYVAPIVAARMGARNALTASRSLLDGGIGALGAAFTVSPSPVKGGVDYYHYRKQLAKEKAIAEKEGREVENKTISGWEMAGMFFKNPILDAVGEAKATVRETQNAIDRANKELSENKNSLENMVEVLSAMNRKVIAREGDDLLQAEDEKDRETITLALHLLSLKNNGAVMNARAEGNVDKSKLKWDRNKKLSVNLSNFAKRMTGVTLTTSPQTSFEVAMQNLQDASTIDELQEYTPGTESIGVDSSRETERNNKNIRQSNLIETFLNISDNKAITQDMSDEEKISFAKERLKKNSSRLLEVMDNIEGIQKAFSKSVMAGKDIDLQRQLVYQYAMDREMKKRFVDIDNSIRGKDTEEGIDVEDAFNERREVTGRTSINNVATFGSEKGKRRMLNYVQKQVDSTSKDVERLSKRIETLKKRLDRKLDNPTKEGIEMEIYADEFYLERLKKNKERLEKLHKSIESKDFESEGVVTENEDGTENVDNLKPAAVISAHEILHSLSPESRLMILDPHNRDNYTEEQQEEIAKAEDELIRNTGLSLPEAMMRVRDAAILSNRVRENMQVAKDIMNNPERAMSMLDALLKNRKEKILEYFNDKVVREAFQDFVNNDIAEDEAAVANLAATKSSAVLLGIKKLAKEKGTSELFNVSDKQLKNIMDGVDAELENRVKRANSTYKLKNFIAETKKLKHEEVNEETNTKTTSEVEMSQNDKRVLDYAIQYASDKDIGVDEVMKDPQAFWDYVDEMDYSESKYDSYFNPEGVTAKVSDDYLSNLISDALRTHDEHLKEEEKAKAPKKTKGSGKSVATRTINPKVTGTKKDEEKAEEKKEEKKEEKEDSEEPSKKGRKRGRKSDKKETESSVNRSILEDAIEKNKSLLNGIDKVLSYIDELAMTDEERREIKEIIRKVVTAKTYKNMVNLLGGIVIAGATHGQNIKSILQRMNSNEMLKRIEDSKRTIFFNEVKSLFTRSLDWILSHPERYGGDNSPLVSFIRTHDMPAVIRNLAELYVNENERFKRKERKNNFKWESLSTVYLYDPALADAVKGSMENNRKIYAPRQSAPVVLAISLKGDEDTLTEDDIKLRKAAGGTEQTIDGKTVIMNNNWIKVKVKTDKKTGKDVYVYYQPIGIMPSGISAGTASDAMRATAQEMNTIRDSIDYRKKGVQIIKGNDKAGNKHKVVLRPIIESINIENTKENGENNAEEPLKSSLELMREDSQNEASRITEDTKQNLDKYNEAVAKDNEEGGVRNQIGTKHHEKQVTNFLRQLFSEKVGDKKTGERTDLKFKFFRGGKGADPVIRTVLTKAVAQTTSVLKGGKKLVDLLKEIEKKTDKEERMSALRYLAEFNPRIQTLQKKFESISIPVLYRENGSVAGNKEAKEEEFSKYIRTAISDVFNIEGLEVETELLNKKEGDRNGNVKVAIKSNDEELVTFEIRRGRNALVQNDNLFLSPENLYTLLDGIILDEDGNIRESSSGSPLVKWQVNYRDADRMNAEIDKELSKEEKKKQKGLQNGIKETYTELYNSGILIINTDRVANTPTVIKVSNVNYGINNATIEKPKKGGKPEGSPRNVAEGRDGKVDANTGVKLEKETNSILDTVEGKIPGILKKISELINRSKDRNLTDDKEAYEIEGQRKFRVTDIKHAIRDTIGRFNKRNAWGLPSTSIGSSADDFLRDVANGVFDDLLREGTPEAFKKLREEMKNYENSTVDNYYAMYEAFKLLQMNLLNKRQVIIRTGDLNNPGKITVFGDINVKVRNQDLTTVIKKLGIAGTIDMLTIDENGDLHLYDFKTKRNAILNKDGAVKDGYDIQLNLYARFLERETGLRVASINIIPIEVKYDTPIGLDNEGKQISGGKVKYELKYPESEERNQLVTVSAKGERTDFTGANFELHRNNIIEWNRNEFLTDEELSAAFDNLTEEEKASLIEEIKTQNDGEEEAVQSDSEVDGVTAEDPIDTESESEDGKGDDRTGFKPEVVTSDEVDGLTSLMGTLGITIPGEQSSEENGTQEARSETSQDNESLDPVQQEEQRIMDEAKNHCRGKNKE